MTFFMAVISIAFPLFVLMDPIGNIPIFISVLKELPPKRQTYIILREMIIALIVIVLFNFIGEFLLSVLGVQQPTILMAGGIILFLIAIKMIFPGRRDPDVDSIDKEPFIVPLAIPLMAGPAVLTAIMLYSRQQGEGIVTITAIVLAWAVSTLILLSSSYLKKIMGWRGIVACERLMGLLLTLIAVQMFLEGVDLFIGRSGTIAFP